jgi:hypothetical protein
MIYLMFTSAIALSACAAYYSIAGLVTIFSAAAIPIMIMGSSLEVAKLVLASWLYRNWNGVPKLLKSYYVFAVVILMTLTSLGIFGFLSKAHSDQSLISGDVLAKVAVYDEKIKILKENIDANRKALKQLDEQVDQVMGRSDSEKGAERSIFIRKSQQSERNSLQKQIEANQKEINSINESNAPLRAQVRKVEAEVGPIKYIAALIYGNAIDQNLLESAVRIVIIMIVIVFDPLAVLMLIGANWSLKEQKAFPSKDIIKETNPTTPVSFEDEISDEQVWDDILENKEEPIDEINLEPQKTIIEEVDELQSKNVYYDSLGRRITP